MIRYVVRTHEDHWENDCIVAIFFSMDDAFEFVRSHFDRYLCDCYSISMEEDKKENMK